jgi:sec1 family domain-containing protein 1
VQWQCLTSAASIERLLGLNHDLPTVEAGSKDLAAGQYQIDSLLNEEGEPVWKVLVFDNLGRDVISSVLRVNDLRSKGVTIHL